MAEDDRDRMSDGFYVEIDGVVWDGELFGLLKYAAQDYQRQLGQTLAVDDLPQSVWEDARLLLKQAVATQTPFASQEAFEAAAQEAASHRPME